MRSLLGIRALSLFYLFLSTACSDGPKKVAASGFKKVNEDSASSNDQSSDQDAVAERVDLDRATSPDEEFGIIGVDLLAGGEREHVPTPPEPTFLRSPVLGTRSYIGSHFEHIFFAPEGDNSEIAKIIDEHVYQQVAFFGGPCNTRSGNCPGDPLANSGAETLPKPSTARSGYLIRACQEILSLDQAVKNVMASLDIKRSDQADEKNLDKALRLFLPGVKLAPAVTTSLKTLHESSRAQGSSSTEAWRMVFSALCASSDDEITFAKSASDEPNPADVFDRCYSQMTQDRYHLTRNDSIKALRQKVVSGEKTAPEACIDVLNLADLSQADKIDDNNTIGKKVLNTLHAVHASWLRNKRFPEVAHSRLVRGTRALHDPEQPAFYFTKALFDEKFTYSQVMTSQSNLTAVRTDMDPSISGPDSNISKATSRYNNVVVDNPKFPPHGELLGIQTDVNWTKSYSYTHRYQGNHEVKGSVNLGRHSGGGFFGSLSYLLTNLGEQIGFVSDGVGKTPRRWARSVYHDLLCRDLPVVRVGDVTDLVLENSKAGFRNSQVCTRCHASGDRLASAIRGVKYHPHPPRIHLGTSIPHVGFIQLIVHPPESGFAAEQGWPDSPDSDFFRRPASGVIFYRNHDGTLIESAVSGLADLGAKFAQLEAPYVCLAKRYYQYFTGDRKSVV